MIRHSRIVASINKRRLAVLLIAGAAICTATALAGATLTPNLGVLINNVVARAGFADPVDIKFKVGPGDQDVIHVSNAQETVMQQVVIAPGGYTGWHTHPGPVLVLVKAGALTLYSSEDPTCTAVPIRPGRRSSIGARATSTSVAMRAAKTSRYGPPISTSHPARRSG